MISFCKSFELNRSRGCLDARLLEPGKVEFRLLLEAIGPTLRARAKSLDRNTRSDTQPTAGFWCSESLITLYETLKFEVTLFDSVCSLEGVKRSHVHRWLSANALVELFVLNETRTFRLTTFADKRIPGSKDGHYTLDTSGEKLLMEAVRELCDMARDLFSQFDFRQSPQARSLGKSHERSFVAASKAEDSVQPVVALGPNGRRRSRKIEPSSVSVPTWPLKVSSSDQDGF